MSTNTPTALSWMIVMAMGIALFVSWPALGDEGDGSLSLEEAMHLQALQTIADALEDPTRLSQSDSLTTEAPIGLATKSTGFTCLPTCAETDGRFLAIASTGLVTLSDPELRLHLGVPAGTTSFTLGVFDGDSAEIEASTGESRWDLGDPALFTYSLIKDPLADGTGTIPVDLDPLTPGVQATILSTSFPNNAWLEFAITTDVAAQAPSGNFFYILSIEFDSFIPPVLPGMINLNAFKVRTDGVVTVEVFEQPFSYMASGLGAFADIGVIYPSFPDNVPTSYDGTFTFFFEGRAGNGTDLVVFGGDFDRGDDATLGLTNQDTDDPDTPDCEPPQPPPFGPGPGCSPPFYPFDLTDDANPEGVSVGLLGSTGNPPDDIEPFGPFAFFVRTPSVRWDLIAPDGQMFANDNPSGNQEWEQFRIGRPPFDPLTMDYATADLPFGTYQMHIEGVDMLNLNVVRFPSRVLCVDVFGDACDSLKPFVVGDTVFFDDNGDGIQDLPGEGGIPGVVVELIDTSSGDLIATTTTDASGNYFFEVDAATYTVRVASESFDPGGALEGYVTTTTDQQTDTVVDDNVLTYDFGYRGTGQIGDRVWNDLDGDGTQNDGATGINGVTVELLDAGGNVLATTTTSGDGNYSFDNLRAGTFTVRIVASTLPAGMVATFDADGIGTLHTATVTLGAAEVNAGLDFGYRATGTRIGDRVWRDNDADGVQDSGEPGINGVTVRLLDAGGGIVATTTTSGDGDYLFEQVSPGVYTVSVDASTLPAGLVPTYDLDGLATPHTAGVTVTGDENRDVDFGYAACGECSGKVTRLTLQYLGTTSALVKVEAKRGPSTGGVFLGTVQAGGTFSLIGPPSGNHGFDGTLGTEIRIYVNGVFHTKIHTSCSVPIGPGLVSGDFAVVFGTSRNNGALCPLDGGEGGGGGCNGDDDDDDDGHHGGKSGGHGDDDDDDDGGACGGS